MTSLRTKFLILAILPLLFCALLSRQASAQSVVIPNASPLKLDEVGLYQIGCQLRGAAEKQFPFGWSGGFDDKIGIACEPAGVQNGESAFLLHPPWRNGVGIAFQTFTIHLPRASKITLRGATALRADAVGKSDGATFRIFVNQVKYLDINRADSDWRQFAVDLTGQGGKTITLRFETDPGPKDNASFDFALWGDRQIIFTGWKPPASHHPAPLPLNLGRLTSRQNNDVAPLSGWPGKTTIHVTSTTAVFRYHGADGTLEYRWNAQNAASPFGTLSLRATMKGDAPVSAPLAAQAGIDWIVPATLLRSDLAASAGGATLTRVYRVGNQQATLLITARLIGKSLALTLSCDKPLIKRFDGGMWGPVQQRISIGVPYYANPVSYLPMQNLFVGAFLDWTHSNASSQSGTQATYGALTNGSRNPLRERVLYTAAWHLAETLPNIPNPPSPYRRELGHRIVFDIWGGDFATVERRLQKLVDDGVPPGVVLLHVWQHSGYDNGLPQHVPANASLGGNDAMKSLVSRAQSLGFRMALHENYTDYYPNYSGFTDTEIARSSDGSRVQAWYNPGTKIQSFAVKPSDILKLARGQGAQVESLFHSNACYLDVFSAVPPWFHVDYDASAPGAGKFSTVWDAHRALWAYERKLHDGPVFGEGNDHWYWSGYLDGVEAQFGRGWPSGDGTDAPLLVDFDLLKIHPLQFNHGMGYYERWWSHGPDGSRSLLDLLDQYRMQEVAYGHAGFLGGSTWDSPSLAWLESHLLLPIMSRYVTALPTEIAYQVGGHWVDTDTAAKADNFTRLRVRYSNGLTIWANSSPKPMVVGNATLPRWGWLARGAGVNAGTTLRQEIVTDAATTADSLFVNARAARDWSAAGVLHVQPTVAKFTSTGPRTFQVTYSWTVGEAPKSDLRCFVHFVRLGANPANDDIAFQQDHALAEPASNWRPGEIARDGPWSIAVPTGIAPGDYKWDIGLIDSSGARQTLLGPQDNQKRIDLGTLHIGTSQVSFTPAPPYKAPFAPINAANKAIDFGDIRTSGSVWIHRDGPDWVLRPFPENAKFTVDLSTRRFPMPAAVRMMHPKAALIPLKAGKYWRLILNGAEEYRWPVKSPG